MKTGEEHCLAFVGDLMTGGVFGARTERRDSGAYDPFRMLKRGLAKADLLVVNFEGPLRGRGSPRTDKSAVLQNQQTAIDFLLTGPSVCSLANNHIMDYGREGLVGTREQLTAAGIPFLGAGLNELEAAQPLVLDTQGHRLGFVAFTSDEPNVGAVCATETRAGCASFEDLSGCLRRVSRLAKEVDLVCVTLHWGHEFHEYPSDEEVRIAHAFVDAGARLVIGHHPHVLQGIERYGDALIAYSLGNFFFSPFEYVTGRRMVQSRLEREFLVLLVKLSSEGRLDYSLVPGLCGRDYQLIPYSGRALVKFLQRFERLSTPIKGTDYAGFWAGYARKRRAQLRRQAVLFAARKLSFKTLKSVTAKDIKRQLNRLFVPAAADV